MQHTLLGLAIACIVALIAALIGPYFVDWNAQRAFFEREAGRLIGLKVRVNGDIKVTLLPVPSVTLRGVEIGPQALSARLRADTLRVDLALSALMAGEFRAVEMHLGAPEFGIRFNSAGQVEWPAVQLAADTLSIDRLRIDDGRVELIDARSGSRAVLDKLWFNGSVRSLAGPLRGEGAFATFGATYSYRINAGRLSDDGMRLRISVDSEGPVRTELDGLLNVEKAQPRFDGNLVVARLAGSVQADGKAALKEPWRLAGKVNASTRSVLLQELSFQYGAEERSAHLTGSAALQLGEQAHLEAALSARQIDIDRLIATPPAPRRLPLAAIQAFAEMFGGALRLGIPATLGIGVDTLTIGGATLQAVGCDLRSDGGTWSLDKLEFRAPGFTQVRLSGRLDPSATALGFNGDVRVDASDPRALIAWLAGRPGSVVALKPWQLRGRVNVAADRVAVEALRAEFDRGAVEGKIAYFLPSAERPARLDAELRAAELDLDALIGFAERAFTDTGFERPREIALRAEIGKAKLAGLEAHMAAAQLQIDQQGIAIEKLAIADFGGAKLDAIGRIDTSATPGGTISLDLDARRLGGMMSLADRFAPSLAAPLRLLAARRDAAKLHAAVSLKRAGTAVAAKLALNGNVGSVRLDVSAGATGKPAAFSATDWQALSNAELRVNGRLETDDGSVLMALAGLGRLADRQQPGSLRFSATGPLSEHLRIDAHLAAGTIDVGAKASIRLAGSSPELRLEELSGTIGGSHVGGALTVALTDPLRVRGAIETEAIAMPAVIATAVGMPAPRPSAEMGRSADWSTEPFAPVETSVAGQIELKARRVVIVPGLEAQQVRSVVRFGPSQLVFDEALGQLGRGRIEGRLAIASDSKGLTARSSIALSGADVASLIAGRGWSAVSGRVGLETEIEGAGMSPAAFVGSLSGRGRLVLDEAAIAGLNPRIFDAVIRAVDLGIPTDADRIRDFVVATLDTGSLPVKHLDVPLAISAGSIRIGPFAVGTNGAEVEGSAELSLANALFESRLRLSRSAAPSADASRPSISISLRGPLNSPTRAVDAGPLAVWLAMRAVEQQAQRLEAAERARRDAVAAEAREQPLSASPALPLGDSTGTVPGEPADRRAPPLPSPVNIPTIKSPQLMPPAKVPASPVPQGVARSPRSSPPRAAPGRPLDLLGGNR